MLSSPSGVASELKHVGFSGDLSLSPRISHLSLQSSLTPSTCAHVSTCTTSAAGEPQEAHFFPDEEEHDYKAKCPWGSPWTPNASSFLNAETRIKARTGGLSQHMHCTHTLVLSRTESSGRWQLSLPGATLGLTEAERSTVCFRLT